MTDGYGLAAPDQLGATLSEIAPPAVHQFRGRAVGVSIPSFHREDAEAVAHPEAGNVARLLERRIGAVEQVCVEV
jgi:hypothetical protein